MKIFELNSDCVRCLLYRKFKVDMESSSFPNSTIFIELGGCTLKRLITTVTKLTIVITNFHKIWFDQWKCQNIEHSKFDTKTGMYFLKSSSPNSTFCTDKYGAIITPQAGNHDPMSYFVKFRTIRRQKNATIFHITKTSKHERWTYLFGFRLR